MTGLQDEEIKREEDSPEEEKAAERVAQKCWLTEGPEEGLEFNRFGDRFEARFHREEGDG